MAIITMEHEQKVA